MRAAGVLLLGFAGGAPGRDIPVYREYTQPIWFYGEQGEVRTVEADAPDQAARQAVHDAYAQEALMGKETILEMAFGPGASMIARPAPILGKTTPVSGGGDVPRQSSSGSGENWLAKSLSLPSLGQKPESAAATAMDSGAKDSRWGWLAGEMSRSPSGETRLPETGMPEMDTAPDVRAATSRQTPVNEPAPTATESAGWNATPIENLQEATPVLPVGMHSYRIDSPAMDLNQTREVLAGFSAGTKPDYASLPTTFSASAPAEKPINHIGLSVPSLGLDSRPSTAPQSLWGARETRMGIGADSVKAAPSGVPSWQGGWKSQNAGGSVLSRIETLPAPVTVIEDPITTYIKEKPRTTSGGYKPAWF